MKTNATYVGKVDRGQISAREKFGQEGDRERVDSVVLCILNSQ